MSDKWDRRSDLLRLPGAGHPHRWINTEHLEAIEKWLRQTPAEAAGEEA